jgi:hypothetical protein
MITGIGFQTFYSIQHIRAAAYFARRAGRLERRFDGDPTSRLLPAIQANVSGALFSSTAFLEATANELFADAATPGGGHLRGADPFAITVIARLGEKEAVDRAYTLDKFDILLSAAGWEPLDRAQRPAQDVVTLIKLRNGLLHYKASWFDSGTDNMVRAGSLAKSKLVRELAVRFRARAHANPGAPDAWIGCECAKWAVQSSLKYADTVFDRLGVKPIYDHVRDVLETS